MPNTTPDKPLPEVLRGKLRRDWGAKNLLSVNGPAPRMTTEQIVQQLNRKVEHFIANAVFPQQLTVPRDMARTRSGVTVYRVLKGRVVGGVQENGVRVVVQENTMRTRYVMSPLCESEYDALTWARREMGAS